MGLKPYEKKISEIFGTKQYAIDFYQREYKWNDNDQEYKPVKSLLDDIFYRFELEYDNKLDIDAKNINNLEWYYLSSYMTNEVDGKIFIVDGQQRLTTLTLIIIKLYHLSKIHKLNSAVQETLKKTIRDSNLRGELFWMGFPDRITAIQDIFENDVDAKEIISNVSQKNIFSNYKQIDKVLNDQLTDTHKLEYFINYLFERIYLIEIKIDKAKDVAMVFEVINDRGIPLRAYEILKGKLLGQINKSDIDKYVDIWEANLLKIEKFGEDSIDDFFSSYFRSKYSDTSEQFRKLAEDKYHRTIFMDDWKAKIGFKHHEKNVKSFVDKKLSYFADVYCDVSEYHNDYDKTYEHTYFNRLNDLSRQFPLILSAIKNDDKDMENKIKTVAKMFDKYYVILNLTGCYKANTFNESMINLISLIRDKDVDNIITLFNPISAMLQPVATTSHCGYPFWLQHRANEGAWC